MGLIEAVDCCTFYRGIVMCAAFLFAFYFVYVVIANEIFK